MGKENTTIYTARFEDGTEISKTESQEIKNRLDMYNWICRNKLSKEHGELIEISIKNYAWEQRHEIEMVKLHEKMNELYLRWRETPENLGRRFSYEGTLIEYGHFLLIAGYYYNGPGENSWFGAIYEPLFEDEIDAETDLGLCGISPGFFKDEGHALEWAIEKVKKGKIK